VIERRADDALLLGLLCALTLIATALRDLGKKALLAVITRDNCGQKRDLDPSSIRSTTSRMSAASSISSLIFSRRRTAEAEAS
jgi:hypothetical protein